MTESVENRLRDTSNACLACYENWIKDKKNAPAAEALAASVHELRKVASRLEIDLAASDRDNGKQKPIQPPVHKTSKPVGSRDEASDVSVETVKKPRRRQPRKAAASE